jgi:hypothetical protein
LAASTGAAAGVVVELVAATGDALSELGVGVAAGFGASSGQAVNATDAIKSKPKWHR